MNKDVSEERFVEPKLHLHTWNRRALRHSSKTCLRVFRKERASVSLPLKP